jgi:phosphoribosylformylglycinamidine synthase
MNEQIELATRKRGIVINFPRLTEKQLNSMIKDVGLKLSVAQLKELQNHYRRVEKRNPTLDELYFLGEYFTTCDNRRYLVNELTTNSKMIAETYADAMEKREAMIKTDAPPSVGELFTLSSRYLKSRGKEHNLDAKKKKKIISHTSMLSEDLFLAGSLTSRCRSSE